MLDECRWLGSDPIRARQRFNTSSDTVNIPDALTAFMLLNNPLIDISQRFFVLFVAFPADPTLEKTTTADVFLNYTSYTDFKYVLRQCAKSIIVMELATMYSNHCFTSSCSQKRLNFVYYWSMVLVKF